MKLNEFAERLTELRNYHNISQERLSEMLFVKQNTVSMWEAGEREPSYDTLLKLSKIFNVTTDYLLGNIDY